MRKVGMLGEEGDGVVPRGCFDHDAMEGCAWMPGLLQPTNPIREAVDAALRWSSSPPLLSSSNRGIVPAPNPRVLARLRLGHFLPVQGLASATPAICTVSTTIFLGPMPKEQGGSAIWSSK
ncbi:hypothetical protein ACQJBY_020886 [Aegilops geniculata]